MEQHMSDLFWQVLVLQQMMGLKPVLSGLNTTNQDNSKTENNRTKMYIYTTLLEN